MDAEILAMDELIIKRVRHLVIAQGEDSDRKDSLSNLGLVLAQLEKIGQRVAHLNAKLRALLKSQLAIAASRPRSTNKQ